MPPNIPGTPGHTPTPNDSPDPTTPGTKTRPTALGAALTGVAVGSPLSLATVWVIENFFTAHGQPVKFDEYTAAAVGAVGASVLTYISQVVTGLISHLQEKWTQP